LTENPSSVEVCAVIQFLNAKQKLPTEIHKDVVEVYGGNVISRKQVLVWCNQFKEGRTSLLDEEWQEDQQWRAMLSMNVVLNNFSSLIVA
jgi:hypothetical protein